MSINGTYPSYSNLSGWNAILAERIHKAAPESHEPFDFIVIGAGFTGLAAARQLAVLKPELRILILEATTVGEGSSARNSGFLISLPHNTKMGGHSTEVKTALKQIQVYESGKNWLKTIIDKHNISCDWSDIGKYHGAATAKGEASLKLIAQQYEHLNIKHKRLNKEELQHHIGTSYYHSGLHTSHNVYIQPAALIRGLADTLPKNVILAENCAVQEIIHHKKIIDVITKEQTYKAHNIILANNGFAKKLNYLKDRLITIYTYAGMTSVLDEEQQALLGHDKEWGLIPANRLGTTLRRTQDGRFVVRSAYSYENPEPEKAIRNLLEDCFKRRYPQMTSHHLKYIWGGVTALTRNGASYFGELAPKVYASVGCNGAGVLKGSIYGKLLAESILGINSEELDLVLSLDKPTWLPPEPLRKLAVMTAINWQKKTAGLER